MQKIKNHLNPKKSNKNKNLNKKVILKIKNNYLNRLSNQMKIKKSNNLKNKFL